MDHHLVRSRDEKGHNFSVGEPWFLQDALQPFTHCADPLPSLEYPLFGGQNELIREIRSAHRLDADQHVVVANGAKQAILAALYALGDERSRRMSVIHREPAWLSYPTLARLLGAIWTYWDADIAARDDIKVNTSPNNPDGTIDLNDCDIWDAAYAHPVYGFDFAKTKFPEHRVSVWSAAKLFGVSGMRIGWMITKDKALADAAAGYVEKTTSGVSTYSQLFVAGILRKIARNPELANACYGAARTVLMENVAAFDEIVRPHCAGIKGTPVHKVGMFAFFLPKDPAGFTTALERAEIKLTPGEAFGPSYKGWYRMNLGHRSAYTRDVLSILGKELA